MGVKASLNFDNYTGDVEFKSIVDMVAFFLHNTVQDKANEFMDRDNLDPVTKDEVRLLIETIKVNKNIWVSAMLKELEDIDYMVNVSKKIVLKNYKWDKEKVSKEISK